MNWGRGIITGMIIFMLFILSMCIYMFRMPADEYDHQYYEKGLSFNKDYDREQQVSTDNAQPSIDQNGAQLLIRFKTPAIGKISLIRPANKTLDKAYPIKSGEDNKVFVLLSDIQKGQWQVILEWEHDSKSYLYQQKIYIK